MIMDLKEKQNIRREGQFVREDEARETATDKSTLAWAISAAPSWSSVLGSSSKKNAKHICDRQKKKATENAPRQPNHVRSAESASETCRKKYSQGRTGPKKREAAHGKYRLHLLSPFGVLGTPATAVPLTPHDMAE